MIQTKEDLRYYISRDRARYNVSTKRLLLGWFLHGEAYRSIRYLKALRHWEYYINNKKRGLFYKIMAILYMLKVKRLGNLYGIKISPNACAPGVRLIHLCGGIIINAKKVGENLTTNTGCVVGKKNNELPSIGNNVDLSVGSKIIGNITIGDNVIVAPNSVVIKDVPDNCIVSGVPAIIIKRMEPKEDNQSTK